MTTLTDAISKPSMPDDPLVAWCMRLSRRSFFAIFFALSLGSALFLSVLTWDLFYGVTGPSVVVVAIFVTILVATPILFFISKVIASLERANAAVKARSDAESRLGRLLQVSYDEVYVLAGDTMKFIEANDSALNNLGLTLDELRQMTPLDIQSGYSELQVLDLLAPLREASGDVAVFDAEHKRKDGSTYPVKVRLQYIASEDPPVFLAVVQDLTEWRKTLDQLRQAKDRAESANQAKSSFLANMSHELRTPLNAILGFSEVLKDGILGPLGSPQYVQYASDIHDSGRHLLGVINGVLDIAKIEAGEQDLDECAVDLRQLIDSCVRLTIGDRKINHLRVVTDVPGDLPLVRADPLKMKQMLINLLSNAVKFTSEGGDIRITAHQLRSQDMELSVSDSGIGMSPEDIPTALSVFGQIDSSLSRKYEGTGLGLPLVKALIESHGGSMNIDSALGRGTTVSLIIPKRRVDCATAVAQ